MPESEDWAPLGQPLPEVLTLPPPLLVDDEGQRLASKVHRGELERRLLQQKVAYLEKVLRKLERERSEFSVRVTMAKEQLKSLHESMNFTIQVYQKKIVDPSR